MKKLVYGAQAKYTSSCLEPCGMITVIEFKSAPLKNLACILKEMLCFMMVKCSQNIYLDSIEIKTVCAVSISSINKQASFPCELLLNIILSIAGDPNKM
jgi:hypothetical protein